MRNLEVIESELAAAREALSNVMGTPAEVYSRIVGYYRSVRNWNKGKREEYGERLMFRPDHSLVASSVPAMSQSSPENSGEDWDVPPSRVLLFVRNGCPACPAAKTAAAALGLPVELVDTGTEEGLAEAAEREVMSTPTALFLSEDGKELARARDAASIAAFQEGAGQPSDSEESYSGEIEELPLLPQYAAG